MTDDGRLLHRAILDNPGEDAPRYAFADWLQDRPEPDYQWYGRFIAEQLVGAHPECLRPDTLLGRAALEFASYGIRLGDPGVIYWRGESGSHRPIFTPVRGFVCHAELTCADFMRCAAPLFARHPVESVTLTDRFPIEDNPDSDGPHFGNRRSFDFWVRLDGRLSQHSDVTPVLFEEMRQLEPRGAIYGASPEKCIESASFTEAQSLLARACLVFGRRAAAEWLLTNAP